MTISTTRYGAATTPRGAKVARPHSRARRRRTRPGGRANGPRLRAGDSLRGSQTPPRAGKHARHGGDEAFDAMLRNDHAASARAPTPTPVRGTPNASRRTVYRYVVRRRRRQHGNGTRGATSRPPPCSLTVRFGRRSRGSPGPMPRLTACAGEGRELVARRKATHADDLHAAGVAIANGKTPPESRSWRTWIWTSRTPPNNSPPPQGATTDAMHALDALPAEDFEAVRVALGLRHCRDRKGRAIRPDRHPRTHRIRARHVRGSRLGAVAAEPRPA